MLKLHIIPRRRAFLNANNVTYVSRQAKPSVQKRSLKLQLLTFDILLCYFLNGFIK